MLNKNINKVRRIAKVLYRDGEFKTIDIEKVKAETQKRTDAILRRL